MVQVEVSRIADHRFAVTIIESESTTSHEVSATVTQIDRIAAGTDPAALVEASIRFLLDREPKESIMGQFDLDTISRFFADYETTIADYL